MCSLHKRDIKIIIFEFQSYVSLIITIRWYLNVPKAKKDCIAHWVCGFNSYLKHMFNNASCGPRDGLKLKHHECCEKCFKQV